MIGKIKKIINCFEKFSQTLIKNNNHLKFWLLYIETKGIHKRPSNS